VLPRLSQRATAFLRRVVALCFYSLVVFFEEPILSKPVGADYGQYYAAVPRWPFGNTAAFRGLARMRQMLANGNRIDAATSEPPVWAESAGGR
jgi:hypothetical protein